MNNRIQLVQKSVNLWHDRFILCCIATISGVFFSRVCGPKKAKLGVSGHSRLFTKCNLTLLSILRHV